MRRGSGVIGTAGAKFGAAAHTRPLQAVGSLASTCRAPQIRKKGSALGDEVAG